MDFPKREHYERFAEKFSDIVAHSDLNFCFYGYGSFINGDFIPEISDLDGGLILDCEFVTPKDFVHELAVGLEHILRETSLGIQFNLMDRAINRDGRFLAYDDTYTEHLKDKANIFRGSNFLQEMNGMNYKREVLRSAAYNLRKVRNGLLMHFVNLAEDPLKARKNIFSSRKVLWDMQKKLIELATGKVVFEEKEVLDTFKKLFPDYDTGSVETALFLKKHPSYYFSVLGNHERKNAFELSKEFVTATELMIQEYVKQNPFTSYFEAAGFPV